MEQFSKLWAFALSATVLWASPAAEQSISGNVSVVNGSQFQMVGVNVSVQLYGIEACAMDQIAHYNEVAWRCGVVSAGWLTQLTLGYEVRCLEVEAAGYASIYGRCFLPNGDDIAKLALEAGMALAVRQDGEPTESTDGLIEAEARKNNVGIWSSNSVHRGRCIAQGGAE